MLILTKLDRRLTFPSPEVALEEPNGLLAFGGDLSAKRLLLAYSLGIFPWYSGDEPLMWWSPNPRGILPLDEFVCSKSLAKLSRKCGYKISVNKAFNQVIDACASIPRNDSGTWITQEMIAAYKNLHSLGHAHSIEVWDNEQLIGGLYGVVSGMVFCGESMFHKVTNASKLASLALVNLMKKHGGKFIDCQMQNSHLASLGCVEVPRVEFLALLHQHSNQCFANDVWQARFLDSINSP
jgi:leucyl/phenylalanyl-tRNA--protein transferase